MGMAEDSPALAAALRARYELQEREKSTPPVRSPAEQALTSEVESFMGTLGSSSSTAEQLALRFCKARRGGCSWSEALVVLDRANQGSRPSLDPADYERATQRMQGSRPLQPLEVCSRVPAASLDASTFLEQYVAASRPVVLTGLLDAWPAAQRSSPRRWDLAYLWAKAANSTVKAYVSPDGEYEAVRKASDLVAGERVCARCAANETVLLRPAETEVRLEHLLWLMRGYDNPEGAHFYLQKHPLRKWRGLGLLEDISPAPHERLAPFLRPVHELLWLSEQCTVGPLHYDENENLHAVLRGRKVFELFHPAEGAEQLYDGHKMRSRHFLWRWVNEAMRGELHSLDPSELQPSYVPFSPVRIRRPDLHAHPNFARSRRVLCEVGEGDVLFLPSYWWHEVTAVPTASPPPSTSCAQDATAAAEALPVELGPATSPPPPAPDCGLTASINYFFSPYYRKLNGAQLVAKGGWGIGGAQPAERR